MTWYATLTVQDKTYRGEGCSSKKKARKNVSKKALLDSSWGRSGGGDEAVEERDPCDGELLVIQVDNDNNNDDNSRAWRNERKD